MKDQQRSGRSLEMGTARVEAFSDGVIAVIITIMALELRLLAGHAASRATADASYPRLPGRQGSVVIDAGGSYERVNRRSGTNQISVTAT